jgi:hypothetical protein
MTFRLIADIHSVDLTPPEPFFGFLRPLKRTEQEAKAKPPSNSLFNASTVTVLVAIKVAEIAVLGISSSRTTKQQT